MRRSYRNPRLIGKLLVGLLIVAAVESIAWAQPSADLRDELPRIPARTFGEDSFETAAAELDSEPAAPAPPSFRGPILQRSKLLGDRRGRRFALQEGGVTLDVSSTQFYQGVTTGGLQEAFQYGGRNDYFLNFDGEKLGLREGLLVTLHGETRYGESVNSLAGTLLAPNLLLSLPLPSGPVNALTGVTFTQILSEEFQVFAGKLNTLDGYQQPLTGAGNLSGFQNTAMLYNPVYTRTIPYSTFGAGISCLREEETVFSLIVYDTNDSPTTSGFDTIFNNGATIYAEWNLTSNFFDRPGNHGLSGSYSTGTYSDLSPSAYLDPIKGLGIASTPKTGSWCLAYNFDQALYVAPDDEERMWGVFGNFGIADSNPSPVHWFASAGISGASRLAGRTADTFGFAYFYLGLSNPLKELAPRLLPLRDEHGIELYYNIAVTPWCQLTPDLQVITPFRDQAETALIVGLRAKCDF
jgi:porin